MKYNAQSGNALWFILIAIVLLGGLTVLMSRSSGTSDDAGDYERGQIDVSELSRYAKSMELAVQNLKTNNKCSENEINFDTPDIIGDENVGAPGDESCDIFSDKGAGMTYRPIATKFLDPAHSAEALYGHWVANGYQRIVGIGTDTATNSSKELILVAPFITKELCMKLNSFYAVSNVSGNPPKEDDTSKGQLTSFFTGSFGGGAIIDGNGNAMGAGTFTNKASGCTTASNDDAYFFYHVLIAR